MTWNECAHLFADDLKKMPTYRNATKVVNKILHLEVDGREITNAEIEYLLTLIENEVGDYECVYEAFDNQETLSLMSQVRQIISQANGGK